MSVYFRNRRLTQICLISRISAYDSGGNVLAPQKKILPRCRWMTERTAVQHRTAAYLHLHNDYSVDIATSLMKNQEASF